MLAGKANPIMTELIRKVENEIETATTLFWHIGRHLQFLIPPIEDGNNFGVDVQTSCIKTLQDRESLLGSYLSDFSSYYWQRAVLLEKIGGVRWRGEGGEVKEVKVVVEDGEHTQDQDKEEDKEEKRPAAAEADGATVVNGGNKRKKPAAGPSGDEPATKTSELTTTKEKKRLKKSTTTTTTKSVTQEPSRVIPDFVEYCVALDMKWFVYVKDAVRQTIDSYHIVQDVMAKNRDKVENPKGGGADGANSMTMF